MVSASKRLQEARLQKGLTLDDVSRETKIRLQFLEAIENGQYHKLPSGTYVQGFVANYADYLGLPKREMNALFRREFQEEKSFTVLPEGLTKKTDFPVHQKKIRQTFLIMGVLFLCGLFYVFLQYRSIFFNPPLEITEPENNASIQSHTITIKGTTDPNVTLTINSIPVSINADGTFTKALDVFTGKTTVKVKAINKFGKETVVERVFDIQSDN